jgi:hypothetical protein
MLDFYVTSLFFWGADIPALIARGLLLVLGVSVAVHLICAANFLEPGTAPAHIGLLLATGVASAIGVVHGAVVGNIYESLIASAVACAALLALSIALWARGMRACDHFKKQGQP